MLDAAVGNLANLARSLEKDNVGLPQSDWKFINFISAELARQNVHNASNSITGSGGMDRGTLGEVKHSNKIKYDATAYRLTMDLLGMVGYTNWDNPVAGVYVVQIRPDRDNAIRSISMYLDEGGSYGPSMQFGRRTQDVVLSEDSNQRIEADVTYSEPLGDTTAGAPVAAVGNTGTHAIGLIGSRGQRKNDADVAKSVYLKVVSSATGSVVLKAKVDVPAFAGAVAYGATTFTVPVPSGSSDGWGTVVDSTSALALGLFGENNEPFEVTFGDVDMTDLLADDVFEIPATMTRLTKTGTRENRLSAYHLIKLIGGVDTRIDKGTVKISRPWEAKYSNGRRTPYAIVPTGKLSATTNFEKPLFDRRFRQVEGDDSRFTLHDVMKFQDPIGATAYNEQVELFQPQCGISDLKGGDVAGFDALTETVTLEAEQPDPSSDGTLTANGIAVPAGFDDTTEFVWQANITLPIDIAFIGA